MARVRDMQGIPAHLTTLKSDGVRRHPAYCRFHIGKGKGRMCDNPNSPIFRENCRSAKNCEYYESNKDDI